MLATIGRLHENILLVAVPITGLLFWRSGTNSFHLPKVTFVMLVATTLVALAAARVVAGIRRTWRASTIEVAAWATVTGAALATLAAAFPVLSLLGSSSHRAGLAAYAAYAVVLSGLVATLSLTAAWRFARAIAIGGSLVAVYGLVQSFGLDFLAWHTPVVPVFSTMGNSNFLSAYVSMVAPLCACLALARGRGQQEKILAWAAVLLCWIVLLRTGSFQGVPAGLVGCGVVLGPIAFRRFFPSFRPSVGGPHSRVVGAGALLLVIVVAALVIPALRDEVGAGLGPRLTYWASAAEVIRQHPVLGVGMDSFGDHYFATRPASAGDNPELAEDPHNVFLAMFVNGGVAVGVPYLVFVLATAVAIIRSWRAARSTDTKLLVSGVAGSWAAYQVQSLVGIDVPAVALFHWALAGVVAALSRHLSAHDAAGAEGEGVGVPRPARSPRKRRTARSTKPSTARVAALAALAVLYLLVCWSVIRPLRADALAGRAEVASRTGNLSAALTGIRRAIGLAGWEARYWFIQSAANERAGRRHAATDSAVRAAELEPGSPRYALLAAKLSEREGDLEEADLWYADALRRDPHRPEMLAESARHDLRRQRPRRSIVTARSGLRLWPGHTELWLALARAERTVGNTSAARDAYQRFLALAPTHPEAGEAKAFLDSGS